MDKLLPVESRTKILDILRGIALFGVFISNLGAFSGYFFLSPEQKSKLSTATMNVYYDFIHYAFIDGKFYSIFSLLFGVGFALFLNKSKGFLVFYKRLLILIGFGIAHAFLLWEGDILLLYGLLGLLLPIFSKLSNRTILIISVFLIFSPILFDTIRVVTNGKFQPEMYFYEKGAEIDQTLNITSGSDFVNIMQKANYCEIKSLLSSGFYYRWGGLIESNRLPKVFALFLLGMLIGRNRWYENLEEKKKTIIRYRKWLSMVGFPMTLLFGFFNVFNRDAPKIIETLVYALSVIPMAFVYVATIVLLYIKNQNRFENFSFVGRMTLTNYIVQSCSAYLFFYGTGWSFYGKTNTVLFPLIAIGFYIIQVVYSRIWLNYFEFGPLEWIWRQLTYGKFIPLKKRV
jgi:uncharacterized protein